MNPFTGVTSADLGVTAGQIVNAGLDLVTILAPILLIGLAFIVVPKFFAAIRNAGGKSNNKS